METLCLGIRCPPDPPPRYYCIALHILTGCPDTLRVGSEVSFAVPNGVTERMVVLQCDFAKGKATCTSSEDVSLMGEEKEVPIEQLSLLPREDAQAMDEAFSSPT